MSRAENATAPGVDGAEGRDPNSGDSNKAPQSTPEREAWRSYRDYADKQEARDSQHERDCRAAAEAARSQGDQTEADRIEASDRAPQYYIPFRPEKGPDGREITLHDVPEVHWHNGKKVETPTVPQEKEFQAAEPLSNMEDDQVREAKLYAILVVRLMQRAYKQQRLCPASVAMALGIDRRSTDEIAAAAQMNVRTLQDHRAQAERFMNYELSTLEAEYATDAPPGFHLKLFWVKDGDNSNRCPLCHAESVGDDDSIAPSAQRKNRR